MKKKLLFTTFFVLGALLAACSDDEKPAEPVALAVPVLTEGAITQVSLGVSWEAVANAVSYTCTLDDGTETSVAQTEVRFDGLEPGRSYTVKVKAVAGLKQFLDSEFARIAVSTLPATQLDAPVLTAGDVTEGSATVVWEPVPDAMSYLYTVDDGAQQQTAEPKVVVTGLEPGMPATVRIRAVSELVQHLDSEVAELTVAAAMEQESFTLSVTDRGTNAISVAVFPKSPTRTYYCGYAPKADFDKYATHEEFIGMVRRKLSASALIAGVSFEEYLSAQLVQGNHPFKFTGLKPETDYVVYVVGWYASADLLTTHLMQVPATTLPDLSGEVTVGFENVATDRFDVVCTPDDAIERYYVYVVKTSSLTMQQLMAGGLEAFKKDVMTTKDEYTGKQTIRKTRLASGTRYTVCVLGICTGGSDFYIEKSQMTEKSEAK